MKDSFIFIPSPPLLHAVSIVDLSLPSSLLEAADCIMSGKGPYALQSCSIVSGPILLLMTLAALFLSFTLLSCMQWTK